MPAPGFDRRSVDFERGLQRDIARFFCDPYGYVLYAFPWGKPGTILEEEDGPDEWQTQFLLEYGAELRRAVLQGREADPVQFARASGHGIGKTAVMAWLILHFQSTRPNPQNIVTAGTKEQLTGKTWRELAKWQDLAINGHWFKWTATAFIYKRRPKTWFAKAVPWSKSNPQAFAGTHERYVLMLFDEASAIENIIWDTSDGALTTPGAIRVVFGNPTLPTGRFADCFGRHKHRWNTGHIDARTARHANRKYLDALIEDWGEDSDYCRVRVRGLFPRHGLHNLIDIESVGLAQRRRVVGWESEVPIIALDVARHGDDESVISIRRGAKLLPQRRTRIQDLMQVAGWAAAVMDEYGQETIIVDATGLGWGVVDRLRQLGRGVIAVQTGEAARDDTHYYNRRVELWVAARDWLIEVGQIPEDPTLEHELITPVYTFDARQRMQLERKEDIKARGEKSPDGADSFVLTFADPGLAFRNVGTPDPDRPTNWRVGG